MINRSKSGSLHPIRRPRSFDIERTKENLSQKTAKSLRQDSYVNSFIQFIFNQKLFRRPFKANTCQKERFSQNTVTLHFKVIFFFLKNPNFN